MTTHATIDTAVTQDIKSLMTAEQWQGMMTQLFEPDQGDLAQLAACLNAPNMTALGDQAHKVKGACAVLGLIALRDVAARVEVLARHAPAASPVLTEASALFTALQHAQQATQSALQSLG